MPDRDTSLRVAAIQMAAQVGAVEANLAHASTLVEEAVAQGARLIVLPELFNTGYEYTHRNFELPEELDGPTATWIAQAAHRLGVHLVGSFPARIDGGRYIVAMLAAPDGRRWIYRKIHVAMWENCYFDRGSDPVIADTDLGHIGLLICWDQVFADLARAYQGRVDLLCIPSSPPTWLGTLEDGSQRILAQTRELRSFGRTLDGIDWFDRAQVLHARTANVPVIYAARSGTFYSPIPFGSTFLLALGLKDAIQVLRAVGTRYLLRCPMMGRSCILDADGVRIVSTGEEGEAVLVATVQPDRPDLAKLPPVASGDFLVPGIPPSQRLFDDTMALWGRRYRKRHAPRLTKP